MKTMKRVLMLALSIVMMSGFMYADDRNIDYSKLPLKARSFLEKHFGKTPSTREVEQECDGYSVELRNGYDVKFDIEGKLVEIDSPDRKTLSQSIAKDVLPLLAIKYLQGKDVLGKINEIKVLRNGDYVVEIDQIVNDYKIMFDHHGDVKKRKR